MDWWEFFLVMIVVLPIMALWIGCIIDIISRSDMSGLSKVLWLLGVLFFPLFGSLIYVLLRPKVVVGRAGTFDESWTAPSTLSNEQIWPT